MKTANSRDTRTARWLVAILALASATALAQREVVDDAGRRVVVPATVNKVFAAGFPAEILLYTLVPEKLVGWNHQPTDAARALLPPQYRSPAPIAALPDRDDAANDRELLAFAPDLYVDYGTIDADYVAALEAISTRVRIPGLIFSGKLTNVPAVYRELGAALGVGERGERLASAAEALIAKYRGSVSRTPVRAYLACSQDALVPCLMGHPSGEAAEILGAINVGGAVESAPQRPLTFEEIRAAAPDVIIVPNSAAAAALRADPAWQQLPAVVAGRVHAPPSVPFNWGPRPPSVNRLLGMLWLAYVLPGRPFDDAYRNDVRAFFAAFYHFELDAAQLEAFATR